jgi:hypothetical protein
MPDGKVVAGLTWHRMGQGASACERGSERLGCINCGEFMGWLRKYLLLEKTVACLGIYERLTSTWPAVTRPVVWLLVAAIWVPVFVVTRWYLTAGRVADVTAEWPCGKCSSTTLHCAIVPSPHALPHTLQQDYINVFWINFFYPKLVRGYGRVIIKAEVPDSMIFSLPCIQAAGRHCSKRWNIEDCG